MGAFAHLRAVSAAGFLLAGICAPQAGGAEPQEVKGKTDAPVAPAKSPPARGAPAAPKVSAEDSARAEEVAKLLPNPPPAAGLETAAGWSLADWEDPGGLQTIDLPKAPLKTLLHLATSGGRKGKSLIALNKDLALPEKGAVRIAVYNPGPEAVDVALAFWVSAAWVYYESTPQKVDAGAWKVLEFDLAAASFKSEKSKWQYTTNLLKRDVTKRIGVLLTGTPAGKPAAVYICGLSAGAPAAAPPADAAADAAADPPAQLTLRIQNLQEALKLVKQAKLEAGRFWPAEREARLRELLRQRKYDAADELLNAALKDYQQEAGIYVW